MSACAFNISYDGDDYREDLSDICQSVVKAHPNMKRGDFVHIENPPLLDVYVIFNGEELLEMSDDDELPEEFKVITEFPIQYWHSDVDVFECDTAKVNFDYSKFRQSIISEIKFDEKLDVAYSSFSNEDKEYRLIYDGLSSEHLNDKTKELAIDLLDEGDCYFSPHPIETCMDEYPANYLYMIPNREWSVDD